MNKHHLWIPVALAIVTGAGCAEVDLGRYCFIGVDPSLAASPDYRAIAVLDTSSADCRRGLCYKQPGYLCPWGAPDCPAAEREPLYAYCTIPCATSRDCDGGKAGLNDCRQYVCRGFGPESGWGGNCGCVCLDTLRDSDGDPISKEVFETDPLYGACRP